MIYGVLGNKEIVKCLGKDLFIYPFNEANLKGASYNLTAGPIAFLESNNKLCINEKDEIVIPPGETVLIQTNESIYLRRSLCGTYHSKVSLVSQGLTHIATTLDPGYFGKSLIAFTNTTKEEKIINVNSSIVTLMFYKVKGCNKEEKDNKSNRDDLMPKKFAGFTQDLSKEQMDEIEKRIKNFRGVEWWEDYKVLIDKVREVQGIKSVGKMDILTLIIIILLGVSAFALYLKEVIPITILFPCLITLILALLPPIKNIFKKIER